jgi:hypothetical protein
MRMPRPRVCWAATAAVRLDAMHWKLLEGMCLLPAVVSRLQLAAVSCCSVLGDLPAAHAVHDLDMTWTAT